MNIASPIPSTRTNDPMAGGAERCEVQPGAGEEAVEEAGPLLHPPETGLHQRGQLDDVALGHVGQGPLEV